MIPYSYICKHTHIQGLVTLTDKITDDQFSKLCQRYAHPTMRDHIKWKKFVEDVDQGIMDWSIITHSTYILIIVFTDANLERTPTKRLTCMQQPSLHHEGGATLWYATATDDQKTLLQQATDNLSAQLIQRRLLARPYFQDFDR